VSSATKDIEYWGHMSYSIVHEEPFTYKSQCDETYACGTYSCGTSKSPQTCTRYCTRTYNCDKTSSRKNYLVNDRNDPYQISYAKYKELDKRWENFGHTEDKIKTVSRGRTTIGDKHNRPGRGHRHMVLWPKTWESSEPLAITHTYENRLQTMSQYRHNITEQDIRDMALFTYPWNEAGYEAPTILSNGPKFKKADKYLRYLNGHLNTKKGGSKKVRLWVLVWKGLDQGVAEYQRQLWKDGNKNEFVVMIGLGDDSKVTWADIMTQSESDILTISTRDQLLVKMKDVEFNDGGMLTFARWLGDAVHTQYVKPSFEQYAYIEVVPSTFAVSLSMVIIMIVNVLTGIFVVVNPWQDSAPRPAYAHNSGTISHQSRPRKKSSGKKKKKANKYYRYR
jgi:hypothetical protein